MRQALSLLSGIVVALACVLLLHRASSLSLFALAGCGVGICLLTRTWAHHLRALRRASVRLRILWRRHAPDALPRRVEAGPFVRRQLGRINPMWLSYGLIAGWAAYEMLDGSRVLTIAPIERAAMGASSAVEAVAGTSAAIRALSAVGSAPQGASGVGIRATTLSPGSEADRLLMQTEGGSAGVMGAAAGNDACEARSGNARCGASGTSRRCGCPTVLDALLPEFAVQEF